jgi:hypothetical protein
MKTLAARVHIHSNRSYGANKPRFSTLTDIIIRAVVYSTKADGKEKVDIVTVATRTIPGKWTEAAAITEFKKSPKLFTFTEGYNAETFRNAA